MSNKGKGFLKIDPLFSAKPRGDQPSFVSNYQPTLILFVFENPFGTNVVEILRRGYLMPDFVSLKIFKLVMHDIDLVIG
jgi:hypothetical protein